MTTTETTLSPGKLAVTAHTTLAEPLITIGDLDAFLTPQEALSLSEELAAACIEICRSRPDAVAHSDVLVNLSRQELKRIVDERMSGELSV